MKKVLMITYHFHPSLEIGAVRSIKFAKFLPSFGWRPYILTVDAKYYDRINESPLQIECETYRTGKWPVSRDINLKMKSWLKRDRYGRNMSQPQPGKDMGTTGGNFSTRKIPLWKRIEYSVNWMPDDKIGWFVPAVRTAVRLIRREGIDIIYSSGPPHSCHLIALAVKKITHKKWVADYRDPWDPLRKSPEISIALSRLFENYLANKVLSNADLIISPVPQTRNYFTKKYGPLVGKKSYTVLNGYDEEDFRFREKMAAAPGEAIRFLYAGNMYSERDPSTFLAAMGELMDDGFLDGKKITIEFMGTFLIDMRKIEEIIAQYNLSRFVEFTAPIKRDEYLDEILNADILILMQGPHASDFIPGKALEYVATGNEVIALMSEGTARDFLGGFENVSFADLDDKRKIKECIAGAITQMQSGRKQRDNLSEKLKGVARRKLTGTLSELMDTLLAGD